MKRIAVLVAVLIGLVWVGAKFGPREEATSSKPDVSPATPPGQPVAKQPETSPAMPAPAGAQEKFLDYLVRSGEEPTVKDATWATDENLYVGVIGDGTSRDGFAEYICSVASDPGVRPELVKIIDVVALKRTGKFEELGKAYCP